MSTVERTGGSPPTPGSRAASGGGSEGFARALDAQRGSADGREAPGGAEREQRSVFERRAPRADVDRFTQVEDAQALDRARRAGRELALRKRDNRRSPFDEPDDDASEDET